MHMHMDMDVHVRMCMILKPVFAPDQEPDDFLLAQNTPLPKDIIGFPGDKVRGRRCTVYPVRVSHAAALRFSGRISFCKPTPSLVLRTAKSTRATIWARSPSRRPSST